MTRKIQKFKVGDYVRKCTPEELAFEECDIPLYNLTWYSGLPETFRIKCVHGDVYQIDVPKFKSCIYYEKWLRPAFKFIND